MTDTNTVTFRWSQLARAVDKVAHAQDEVDELVAVARDAGASWATIAEHLGVTRQAAWKRYGKGEA